MPVYFLGEYKKYVSFSTQYLRVNKIAWLHRYFSGRSCLVDLITIFTMTLGQGRAFS